MVLSEELWNKQSPIISLLRDNAERMRALPDVSTDVNAFLIAQWPE